MATHSIKKNIVISDRESATAFVEALEKAESIAQKNVSPNNRVRELKGSKNIKAFFGDKL